MAEAIVIGTSEAGQFSWAPVDFVAQLLEVLPTEESQKLTADLETLINSLLLMLCGVLRSGDIDLIELIALGLEELANLLSAENAKRQSAAEEIAATLRGFSEVEFTTIVSRSEEFSEANPEWTLNEALLAAVREFRSKN